MLLHTARLDLREFAEGDWRDLYAIESDPDVARYQTFEPRTAADARAAVQEAIDAAHARPRCTYDLAVLEHATDRVVGRSGLHITNPAIGEAIIWYTLHRSRWGRGYIPEAMRALVGFGFSDLQLHRVWADCDPSNRASIRVLEKLGMRREGHLRESSRLKGEWVDSLIYAVLAAEWTAR
jgi:RimJ/RimL family protein N-acetyltransferase